jgi:hypothetical protein
MSFPSRPLPPDVLVALRQGHALEAIKLLRQATGLGLKESKELIDAHLRAHPADRTAASTAALQGLSSPVAQALMEGRAADAIKLLVPGRRGAPQSPDELAAASQQEAQGLGGLSPGEVPRSQGLGGWVVVAGLAVLVGYYFLQDFRW